MDLGVSIYSRRPSRRLLPGGDRTYLAQLTFVGSTVLKDVVDDEASEAQLPAVAVAHGSQEKRQVGTFEKVEESFASFVQRGLCG